MDAKKMGCCGPKCSSAGTDASKAPCCKACHMPMRKPEDFGTNPDGSKSKDLCCHCMKKGKRA